MQTASFSLLHFAAEVINPEKLTDHLGTRSGFGDYAVFLHYTVF